jgi:hypothetical protein
MPSRRRKKSPAIEERPLTDAERFAAALRDSERAEQAARQRAKEEREEAARVAAEAVQRERTLASARGDLDRAVEAVREAKRSGSGRAAADETWKVAKARLIELETGAPPAWAPARAVDGRTDAEVATSPEDGHEQASDD